MRYCTLTDEERSIHPSIRATGSVKGMKDRGYWGQNDDIVRDGDYFYNLSISLYTNARPDVLLQRGEMHESCMECN